MSNSSEDDAHQQGPATHAPRREGDELYAYVESQAHEEAVHLEKAPSEMVGPVRHDIWNVYCPASG